MSDKFPDGGTRVGGDAQMGRLCCISLLPDSPAISGTLSAPL